VLGVGNDDEGVVAVVSHVQRDLEDRAVHFRIDVDVVLSPKRQNRLA
jgi:hypothetical protein